MMMQSARKVDENGFITVDRNPISREGVFQYGGNSIPGADPTRIYSVYRPAEELNNPEALKSFEMLPLVDDHPPILMGNESAFDLPEKPIHGSTGEDILFEDGILYAKLRIFSDSLKSQVAADKKQLSMGYRCKFEKSSGVFNGQPYDYVQKNIRGNHIALVHQGRSGADIAVLDHDETTMAFDHFDLALDTAGDEQMADEDKKDAGESEAKKEMSMAEVCALLETILPQIKSMQDSLAGMTASNTETDAAVADADSEKDDEDDKGAMDAAEIKTRLASLENRDTKSILRDISARDTLAKEISELGVGTFDHAEMTVGEVAEYGLKSLNLTAPKGQERAVLNGYIAGRKSAGPEVGFAMDVSLKADGLLGARLNKNKE